MNISHLRTFALAGLLSVAALGQASPARADVTVAPSVPVGKLLTYNTTLTPKYGVGEYAGTLRITIDAAGIVNGFYQNDEGQVSSVTGGVRGTQIWFDVANYRRLHVNGTLAHNQIVGYSLQRSYAFTANLTGRELTAGSSLRGAKSSRASA